MDKELNAVKKGDVIRGVGMPERAPFVSALQDAVSDRGRGVTTLQTSAGTWCMLGHFRVECKSTTI